MLPNNRVDGIWHASLQEHSCVYTGNIVRSTSGYATRLQKKLRVSKFAELTKNACRVPAPEP